MAFPAVYGGTFSVAPSVTSLPAYTAHARPSTAVRQLTEHLLELKDKKKKAWATLKLSSNARNSTSLPTFLEGDKITGSVTLDLSSSENILGVSILIRGQIITGPQKQDRVCFLDTSTPLWLKGMPNPREPGAAASDSHYSGKLSGDYHWPFSISLPKEVTLPDKQGRVRTFHLPQTFLERTTRASVYYELFVHIARSTFRVDNKLQTMFVYVPAIRPDPPSRLRQLAYREDSPIPGPEMDPEGWLSLPTVTVKGAVFSTRGVKIRCMLSLAKPLSYTRGSAIPCSVIYWSQDSQALNLLCTPSTINVCLHRQVTYDKSHAVAEYAHAQREAGVSAGDAVLEISRAVWWPVNDGSGSDGCRFDGEIHLPKSLKPSSAVSHFAISYSVTMLPFQVTGFVAVDSKPLLKQEVQIATMFAKGPKPKTHAPPSYEYEIGDNMFIPPARGFI
ncbi:hypothetical protein B0H10DRAFT_1785291 [Mycena sp. CBHHK59/15]|nr:hypothetical protein B0H10DRAFT_1785291 [Mycena sp. CBHHK59/15]